MSPVSSNLPQPLICSNELCQPKPKKSACVQERSLAVTGIHYGTLFDTLTACYGLSVPRNTLKKMVLGVLKHAYKVVKRPVDSECGSSEWNNLDDERHYDDDRGKIVPLKQCAKERSAAIITTSSHPKDRPRGPATTRGPCPYQN